MTMLDDQVDEVDAAVKDELWTVDPEDSSRIITASGRWAAKCPREIREHIINTHNRTLEAAIAKADRPTLDFAGWDPTGPNPPSSVFLLDLTELSHIRDEVVFEPRQIDAPHGHRVAVNMTIKEWDDLDHPMHLAIQAKMVGHRYL